MKNSIHTVQITDQKIMDVFQNIGIPPCHSILAKLLDLSSKANLDDLVALISQDVCLSASILKLTNLMGEQTISIKKSALYLGIEKIRKLRNIALLIPPLPNEEIFKEFWRASAYKALASQLLVSRLPNIKVSHDEAYLFGLFCNIGIAVLLGQFHGYQDTLNLALNSWTTFTDVEEERHQVNHALIGAVLAREWGLHTNIVMAIGYHHDFGIFSEQKEHKHISSESLDLIAIGLVAEYMSSIVLKIKTGQEWQKNCDLVLHYLGISASYIHELTIEFSQ